MCEADKSVSNKNTRNLRIKYCVMEEMQIGLQRIGRIFVLHHHVLTYFLFDIESYYSWILFYLFKKDNTADNGDSDSYRHKNVY